MAETLKAKIALDGGDDIRRQLSDLGRTGKQAFDDITNASRSTSQAVSSAQSTLGQLVSAFQDMVQQVTNAGKGLGDAFKPLVSATGEVIGAIAKTSAGFSGIAGAAGAVTNAIAEVGQSAADSIAKLNDAAEAAGLTLDKYRALKAGLEGIGQDAAILQQINDIADEAARKSEVKGPASRHVRRPPQSAGAEDNSAESADALKNSMDGASQSADKLKDAVLGVDRVVTDLPVVINGANGELVTGTEKLTGFASAAAKLHVQLTDMLGEQRKGVDIQRDFVSALMKIEPGAKRTELAVEAFGQKLAKNVEIYIDHRREVEAMRQAVEQAGASFSDAQVAMADRARQTGVAVASVTKSWVDYFKALATPVTIDRNNAILDFLAANKEAIKDFADNVVAPAVRWLGEFKNALGTAAIAAGALGTALGLLSPVAGAVFGAAGVAAIAFGDDIKNGAIAAMKELTRIVKENDLTTFEGWRNAAAQVWEDIKQIVVSAYQSIKASVLSAVPSLKEPWEAIERAVANSGAAIAQAVEFIVSAIDKIISIADGVAAVINQVFGTKFTGVTLIATLAIMKLAASFDPIPTWLKVIITLWAPFAAGINAVAIAVKEVVVVLGWLLDKLMDLASAIGGRILSALRSLVGEEVWAPMEKAVRGVIAVVSLIPRSLSDVKDAIVALYNHWDELKAHAVAAGQAIQQAWNDFWSWLDGKWQGLKDAAQNAGDAVKNAFSDAIGWIEDKWDALVKKIRDGLAYIGLGGGGGKEDADSSSIPGHAGGGLISGAGTGTSDSILSWVSNGEFIMNARAVGAFGADFFHMLNNLQMPGLALEGLSRSPVPMPALSSSSQTSQRNGLVSFPLDLGGQSYDMFAHRDTVADLERHSALRQISATTKRNPGWHR